MANHAWGHWHEGPPARVLEAWLRFDGARLARAAHLRRGGESAAWELALPPRKEGEPWLRLCELFVNGAGQLEMRHGMNAGLEKWAEMRFHGLACAAFGSAALYDEGVGWMANESAGEGGSLEAALGVCGGFGSWARSWALRLGLRKDLKSQWLGKQGRAPEQGCGGFAQCALEELGEVSQEEAGYLLMPYSCLPGPSAPPELVALAGKEGLDRACCAALLSGKYEALAPLEAAGGRPGQKLFMAMAQKAAARYAQLDETQRQARESELAGGYARWEASGLARSAGEPLRAGLGLRKAGI